MEYTHMGWSSIETKLISKYYASYHGVNSPTISWRLAVLMKFKLIQPLAGSASMVAFAAFVALQPSYIPGGTAAKSLGWVVCAKVLLSGMHPLSVKFCPWSTGSSGGGMRAIRKGTPGHLTLPFPLIKMESPHLKSLSFFSDQWFDPITYSWSMLATLLTVVSVSLVKWLQSERSTGSASHMAWWSWSRSLVLLEMELNGAYVPSLGLKILAVFFPYLAMVIAYLISIAP